MLCHLRRFGLGSVGNKPPDLCAVIGCQPCHDKLDKRDPEGAKLVTDEVVLMALMKTLQYWQRRRLVEVSK